MIVLLVLSVPVCLLARHMATDLDRTWLPTMIVAGWIAKMLFSAGRHWALQVLYRGVGDATGYHGAGERLAVEFRALDIPEFATGTQFIDWITGLLYVPYIPTKLGGFFLYATLAFFGQVLLYAAFRRAFPSERLKWYAALIFFFANLLYWPSSIGKDALMVLFIGIAAYGAVRLFADYRPRWLPVIAIGVAGSGVIRSHIGLLLVGAIGIAIAVGRRPKLKEANFRRIVSLAGLALVAAGAIQYAIADFGIDLSGGINETLLEEELDPVFAGVEKQTDKGGSAVEGGAIRSIVDIPEGVIRVIFRPLITDAHNAQALANSIVEGTFLLALFIWRGPAIVRNFRHKWRDPYMLFSLVYVAGFVFGHSAVLNLAIMARQRSQAIPFVIVILVELGAKVIKKEKPSLAEIESEPPRPARALVAP